MLAHDVYKHVFHKFVIYVALRLLASFDGGILPTPLRLIMDKSEVRSLLHLLQSTDLDLDEQFLFLMQKTCVCLETITAERCRAIVRMAGTHPCLQIVMSDGWSVDSRTRFHSASESVAVSRVGRLRTEYIVQRSMVKALVAGTMHLGIKLERPRQLSTKRCADIWSAACDHAGMLKLQQHRGISLTMYVQDGLFAQAFGSRMHARHALFFRPGMCPLDFETATDREVAEMKDWVFSTKCAAHSCSTALKWGMKRLVTSETLVDDVHITISSLLRGSSGLFQNIDSFLTTFAVFDRPDPPDEEALERMWEALDVEAKDVHLFVLVDPLWHGGRLHVRRSLLDHADCYGCIKTIVQYCLAFIDFSDTRWVKVGACGRRFVRALMVGVEQLVEIAEADDGVSKWHLAGFRKKGSAAVRLYLSVSALGARPSEGLLAELLNDDRLLLHSQQYWNVLHEEMVYISCIAPPLLYITVSALLGMDMMSFKSHVLTVGLVSISYLYLDVWKPLQAPPLKFAIGDIRANVEELKSAPVILHGTAAKIQGLCLMGCEEDCVQALTLLREASFTSTLVEQAHGSGAQLMRRHPQLGYGSLVDRMTVHNGRTLFHPNMWEKAHDRLSLRLAEIEEQMKNTAKITNRHAYIQMLVQECKRVHLAIGGTSMHAQRRAVFRVHGPQFAGLSHLQQASLRVRAAAMKRQKVDELSEAKDHILGQMNLLRLRRAESEQQGLVNHMDSVRFTDEEFERFSQLFETITRSTLGGLQAPPQLVPKAVETLIQAEIDKASLPLEPHPDWLSAVVVHRDRFEGTAFYSLTSSPEADKIYKFMMALASPYKAVFLECVRCSLSPGAFVRYAEFSYRELRLVGHKDVPWVSKADMMVYPEVLVTGNVVRTIGQPMPFSVFSQFHRAVAAPRARGSDTRSKQPTDPEVLRLLQLEYPWLTIEEIEALLSKARHDGATSSSSSSAKQDGATSRSSSTLPEDAVAAVAAELEALRQEAGHGAGEGHFRVRVLGGEWSSRRFNVASTDIGSFPVDKSTRLWCTAVGWPPAPGQKTFACRKFGVEAGRRLAEELTRRANHFIDGWIDAGSPSGFAFDSLHASYRSPEAFNTWFEGLPLASDAWRAAMVIRDLIPQRVPE